MKEFSGPEINQRELLDLPTQRLNDRDAISPKPIDSISCVDANKWLVLINIAGGARVERIRCEERKIGDRSGA
jgi:hypothetical protein